MTTGRPRVKRRRQKLAAGIVCLAAVPCLTSAAERLGIALRLRDALLILSPRCTAALLADDTPSQEAPDKAEMVLPLWLAVEAPVWRWMRRSGTLDNNKMRLAVVRSSQEAGAFQGYAATRLQRELQAVCDLFARLGLSAFDTCPDSLVSDAMYDPSGTPIWSAIEPHARGTVVVVQQQLLNAVNDQELRALLGWHLGQRLLSPHLPAVWSWGRWLALSRLYVAWKDVTADLDIAAAQSRRSKDGSVSALIDVAKSTGVEVAPQVAALQALHLLFSKRNAELSKAADRFAVVAGGGVPAARTALAKAHELTKGPLSFEARIYAMHSWSSSAHGQRVLRRAAALTGRAVERSSLTDESPTVATLPALSAPASVDSAQQVARRMAKVFVLLVAPATVTVRKLLHSTTSAPALAALLAAYVGTGLAGAFPWQATSTAFCLYCVSLALLWWRCAQIRCAPRGRYATVESLAKEALPATTEAAAGAALLAQLVNVARQWNLAELDCELHKRWSTAMRRITATLADLRRLVGSDASSARLCSRVEQEMRRALAMELAWMRQALELEEEDRLLCNLMWWLEEAPDHIRSGTPRMPEEGFATGSGEAAFEKLPYPSLSGASGGLEKLRLIPAHLGTSDVETVVERSLESYRRLEAVRAAVAACFDDSPGVTKAGAHCLSWRFASAESAIKEFLEATEDSGDSGSQTPTHSSGLQRMAKSFTRVASKASCSCLRASGLWELAIPLVPMALFMVLRLPSFAGGMRTVSVTAAQLGAILEAAAVICVHAALFRRMQDLRMPATWAALEERLTASSRHHGRYVAASGSKPSTGKQLSQREATIKERPQLERLLQLKAFVLMQGVRSAQNLEYIALCVQAEALQHAAHSETGRRSLGGADVDRGSRSRFVHQCLQLLFAVLPRHGREGQRLAAQDPDIYQAMVWFTEEVDVRHGGRPRRVGDLQDLHVPSLSRTSLSNLPAPPPLPSTLANPTRHQPQDLAQQQLQAQHCRALQVSLASSQRKLWMLIRLLELRSAAKPFSGRGTLAGLLDSHLSFVVCGQCLRVPSLLTGYVTGYVTPEGPSHRSASSSTASDPQHSGRAKGSPGRGGGASSPRSTRSHPTLDADSASIGRDSEASSVCSGSGQRRILAASEGNTEGEANAAFGLQRSFRDRDDLRSEDGDSISDASSVFPGEGDAVQRILAASDAASDISSESASSAGFRSFGGVRSSIYSGAGMSAASSKSSVTEDMLAFRRPQIESYATALRPLFMTRIDLIHLLSKFPQTVLTGGPSAGGRNFAAHRELLEELFASLVVAVKSPERRGSRIKLVFGESAAYLNEPYSLGTLTTTLHLVAHGVRRTGHEQFPVVYEEDEREDEDCSDAGVSAARNDETLGGQGVLEFEEVVIPLTEVSSRELFLAELMQSDQCQLLASLSQGSHSKYGHRALRRRRRTLRHVREATQLLANVPGG
eukprot:TRINITY_DN90814_c0_g1_i1.p1 TRINITY_DN90814_c0_g1~~TRINITY_DN90814_c0_g1_i1.p1  ORF type:complete len:1456 (-),score=272.56 TRINITY_DN90814_c0_g1_i1:60-4427(-)